MTNNNKHKATLAYRHTPTLNHVQHDFVCHVRWLCCIRPITITNLNVLSGIAERDNGDLITYILYKWSRDFRKPAYKAGKRDKRERTNGILLYIICGEVHIFS
ncbi:hypothetical protein T03_6729 [Trichinella britovi]|uniref:Uncharacterized protein n=1 Tax=Trichinella britovi TaxID=45882 RepID=A0A0V1BGK9_TRIBR|nr:hypothetical protein T03_8363 [Trichinella britovi]KRY36060.1 hypothetical protein T03_3819 [Trichinella britovi]KRY36144.1 hypothetical protein T03_6729 [Trichinella britovi]